jgi:hypothetical protein
MSQAELERLLSENAEISAKCDQLERHLVTVARTLENNLKHCIARNQQAEQETLELEERVEEKEAIISQTKSLLTDLCHCGLDMASSDRLNLEYYSQLFEGEFPQWIQGCEQFDPIVYHIVSTTGYFRGCKSNDEFLVKCAELMAAIADLSEGRSPKDAVSDDEDYEAKLRAEQLAFQRHFAHKAVGTKRLIDEQSRLQVTLERSRLGGSGAADRTGIQSGSPMRSSLFV